MIGLCGAHGTGKTTLAELVAKVNEIPFVKTTIAGVYADMGLDPKIDYPFDVRLDIQERILTTLETQWAEPKGGAFVTDRTPIDLMAYTLADVHRETLVLTPALEDRLEKYLKDCVRVSNRLFSILIVVQPGLKLVDREGRGAMSRGYVEHLAALVMGLVVSEDVKAAHYYIPRSKTALQERLASVNYAVNRAAELHEGRMKERMNAGVRIH